MDWHARFIQQASWTHHLRDYLFARVGLADAPRVLDVGCGTGSLLAELPARTHAAIHGLDIEPRHLAEAHFHAPAAILTHGDVQALPYTSYVFDITFCHYLLLWVRDPLQALGEMRRVTRQGGHVLALAEPDYSKRIDRPEALAPLGRWQRESLLQQGADADVGGRLVGLFTRAGIKVLEAGTLQREGMKPNTAEERELEWVVLEADLNGFIPEEEIRAMKRLDGQAWKHGERLLYVPTFFACGVVTT
jgi:SAM-dependent methyltransferase